MNMRAVGGYFRGAREVRGFSTAEVARLMGERLNRAVGKSTVTKIELGEYNPGADLLVALIAVLGLPPEQFHEVALHPELSGAEGEALGRRAAAGEGAGLTAEERRILDRIPPEKRRRAIELLRAMLDD